MGEDYTVGEERATSGIPKVAGTRRNSEEFCKIAHKFVIRKSTKRWELLKRGENWE